MCKGRDWLSNIFELRVQSQEKHFRLNLKAIRYLCDAYSIVSFFKCSLLKKIPGTNLLKHHDNDNKIRLLLFDDKSVIFKAWLLQPKLLLPNTES